MTSILPGELLRQRREGGSVVGERGTAARDSLITRGLRGVLEAFDLKGGGGGPRQLRNELGVLWTTDIQDYIDRQATVQEIAAVGAAAAGANTTAAAAAFLNVDQYILGLGVTSTLADAPNVDWIRVNYIPPDNTAPGSLIPVWLTQQADILALAAGEAVYPNLLPDPQYPFYLKRQGSVQIVVRTNAGGAAQVNVQWIRTRAEEGIGSRIAR